jgi:hypothetical protein
MDSRLRNRKGYRMAKLDWRRTQFVGRLSLDFRREFEFEDRAARWLQRAEQRNQAQRRQRQREYRTLTAPSSSVLL